jgi:hypothetical protein
MDIPISVVEWEVFLPEQYKVKHFGGDAIAMNLLPADDFTTLASNDELDQVAQVAPGVSAPVQPGQVGGVVMDPQGAVIAGAKVKVTNLDRGITRIATTDSAGVWIVLGMPAGRLKIEAAALGFKTLSQNFAYNGTNAARFNFKLTVGEASTTVEVTAEAPLIDTSSAQVSNTFDTNNGSGLGNGRHGNNKGNQRQQQPASANVFNLQKKVVGVLPVRVDVPRAGASYRFARMLVLDEQTRLTFDYKTR